MTTAALAALALADSLDLASARDDDLTGVAARFQRALARVNKGPWLLATGEDFRSPWVDGVRPGLSSRLMHHYLDRVVAHTTYDQDLRKIFLEVLHMLETPKALFRPAVVAKVLVRPRPLDARS
jgi:hypothetical protein